MKRPPEELLRTLLAAKIKLMGEHAWCQGEGARRRDGRPTAVQSEDATAWSILGALIRADGELRAVETPYGETSCWGAAADLLAKEASLDESAPRPALQDWNDRDDTSFEDVLALLDRGIKKMQGATNRAEARKRRQSEEQRGPGA